MSGFTVWICNGAKYSWLDGYGHASEQCPAGYRVEYKSDCVNTMQSSGPLGDFPMASTNRSMVYACKESDGGDKL